MNLPKKTEENNLNGARKSKTGPQSKMVLYRMEETAL